MRRCALTWINLRGRMTLGYTGLHEVEHCLSETDRHLRGIVGSAMDAVITVDAEQNIVMFNGMAEKVFRCPAEAAMGTALERVNPERFRAAHRRQPL